MPSCYIHIQYGNIMPLDNVTIEKLNEMTAMVGDKSKLDESNIEYVKSLFVEIIHGGSYYDVDEINSWLEYEGSWKNAEIRARITNISHYIQSRHKQSDNLHIIQEDSCGCGGSC